MAGVFSVVGLIGLVILIALIMNIIRRREARKFDKELRKATQEAAATAPNPNFLDDEDDERKLNGYSDASSHGTYRQPPVQAYNMRHMGGYPDEYDSGAAGIGLSRGAYPSDDGRTPYPQFAMARDAMAPYETYADGPFGRGRMALGAAAAASGQQQQQQYSRSPPPRDPSNLGRSKSNSTAASHSTPTYTPQPSYPVGATTNFPNPHTHAHAEEGQERMMKSSAESVDDAAAYGGYVESDVEEEVPRRVLKVCYGFF